METTGITRRIDELGRIVIPKEIRKNMHIKSGELLEIYVNDSDSLVLKKHSIINNKQMFIKSFIKKLGNIINGNVFLTSLDEVIFSSNEKIDGKKFNSEMENLIKSDNLLNNNATSIKLTDNHLIEKPFEIYKISPNGDINCLLIIEYKEQLSMEDKTLLKFSVDLLTEYLEEN